MSELLRLVHGDRPEPTFDETVERIKKANAEQDRPKVDDPLPNVDRATIDRTKLTGYSLAPEHPRNRDPETAGAKMEGWRILGYDLTAGPPRERAATDIESQLRAGLPAAGARPLNSDDYGQRFRTVTPIVGPNGRHGRCGAGWIVDNGNDAPRLLTIWAQPDREGRKQS